VAILGKPLITFNNQNEAKASLQLLATNSDLAQMKCFAFSYDPATPDLVAVGTSAGRIFLTNVSYSIPPFPQ